MKKILLVLIVLLISVATIGLTACDGGGGVEDADNVFGPDAWLKSTAITMNLFDQYKDMWVQRGGSDIADDLDDVASVSGTYARFTLRLKNSFFDDDTILTSISFIVTSEEDCVRTFSIWGSTDESKPHNSVFVQKEVTLAAGVPQLVTLNYGDNINNFLRSNSPDISLSTESFTLAEEGKGDELINGVEYNSEYTCPEVGYTLSDIKFTID